MERNDAFYKTFPFTLLAVVIISAVLWIIFGKMYGISYALGGMTSMFGMSMLHRSSKKVVESDKVSASRLATRNYFFRYFFYALVLFVAGYFPTLDLLTAGIGLFIFKIVFYIVLFVESRGEKQDV